MMALRRELTIVAAGDETSRKTELLIKYTQSAEFWKYFVPQLFDGCVSDITVDYIPYTVQFINACSDDDYEILRWNAYEKADVVLLCYSIDNRRSYESIIRKWCVEVRRARPNMPLVLVATDTEARAKGKLSEYITTEEGENLKYAINACCLVECSVEKMVGIDDVFIEAVRSTYCDTQSYLSFYHSL